MLAGGSRAQIEALDEYGFAVGVAYQIRDDFADTNDDRAAAAVARGRAVTDRWLKAEQGAHVAAAFEALEKLPEGDGVEVLRALVRFVRGPVR